jgi:diacylglycerol O-acyltransferase
VDRMSLLDTAFLRLEHPTSPMNVGSVCVMAGPAPPFADVVHWVESRLPRIPRARQRPRRVPGGLGRPVWADDPSFQLLHHVRHTRVPSPGGDSELQSLASRILARQLNPGKPLWELWAVEGLDDGRWAVIVKVHHAMADGVAHWQILHHLFDDSPRQTAPPAPRWRAAPPPGRRHLVASALRSPLDAYPDVRSAVTAVPDPGTSVHRLRLMGTRPRPSVRSLNDRTGPHRWWTWTEFALTDVQALRRALGGTMNDLLLAMVTRGFRDLLLARNEPFDDRVVRTLVPVSVRKEGEQDSNRVSALPVELPIGTADPLDRFADLRAQTRRLKESHQAQASDVLVRLAHVIPAPVSDAALRAAVALPQSAAQTITSNVPGSSTPLYLLDRRMLTCHPFAPLCWRVRIAVGIFSYVDRLSIGVTADAPLTSDARHLAAGIRHGYDELQVTAAQRIRRSSSG